ncbi:hypothetical protein [Lysobacter capsici]|uniref:hypothetical protein n=1 Tax=Lysobacter capsici TaxID=435897 RepID=UPI0011E05832|nr:hypothetical protein [Lysobacter capsici]
MKNILFLCGFLNTARMGWRGFDRLGIRRAHRGRNNSKPGTTWASGAGIRRRISGGDETRWIQAKVGTTDSNG